MLFVKEIIEYCVNKGYIIGIVIGGSKKLVEKILFQYGLSVYIFCVVVVEDVENSKLVFDCYVFVMDKLGKIFGECVVIEDM